MAYRVITKIVTASIVWPYIVMAYIVMAYMIMALYSYGLYDYGPIYSYRTDGLPDICDFLQCRRTGISRGRAYSHVCGHRSGVASEKKRFS